MSVVTDTGPILHLHWIGASAWALPPQQIAVVEAVWQEVMSYAPPALQEPRLHFVVADPRPDPRMAAFHLDSGESEALRFALALPTDTPRLVLCDELPGRQVCRTLSLPVTGSIGLIVAAFRANRVDKQTAANALRALPRTGRLFIRASLIEQAVGALDDNATR